MRDLAKVEIDVVISSANGTFIDRAESRVLHELTPNAVVYTAKPALGESVGAAGLWQLIIAAQALSSGRDSAGSSRRLNRSAYGFHARARQFQALDTQSF